MTLRVDTDSVPHVAIATLDRPAKRNAIDVDTTQRLDAFVTRVEQDEDLWVGVLTAVTEGERPVFCAGADLTEVGAGRGELLATEEGGLGGFAYRQRSKPWIAAVDGAAVGGGFELVLACDLVVATPRSTFALPEVQRGLLAGAGGVQRLPLLIPPRVALRAILTGQPLGAGELDRFGFLAALVEPGELMATALHIAAEITQCAPAAVREARALARSALFCEQSQFRLLADAASARVAVTADAREGVRAFLDKREPVWTGR